MKVRELSIPGVFEITLAPIMDNRGFFMRTYEAEIFRVNGLITDWTQENHSRSERKGILRGLHFQVHPFEETKLVRCIRGEIFDVAVDLRKGSPTFGRWTGICLSESNYSMLYIPRGFAHGFCTLTDISEVVYKVDNIYSPAHERGILWNDRKIAIEWPVNDPYLSDKDKKNLTLEDYLNRYNNE